MSVVGFLRELSCYVCVFSGFIRLGEDGGGAGGFTLLGCLHAPRQHSECSHRLHLVVTFAPAA